ncbi:MAG: hypothetical protein ACXWLH_04755 [Candidatus Saccharimonadales bacterium]
MTIFDNYPHSTASEIEGQWLDRDTMLVHGASVVKFRLDYLERDDDGRLVTKADNPITPEIVQQYSAAFQAVAAHPELKFAGDAVPFTHEEIESWAFILSAMASETGPVAD